GQDLRPDDRTGTAVVRLAPADSPSSAGARRVRPPPSGARPSWKKGQHPSPTTVMRMLREHDEQMAATEPAR
ncbi:hypothetical protein ACFQ7S_24530, partial [Streptomyces sp. NPDC056491]